MKLKIISLLTIALLLSVVQSADARYIAPKKKVRQQQEEALFEEPMVFEGTSDYAQYPAALTTGQYILGKPAGLRAIIARLRAERMRRRQHPIEETQYRIRTGFY